MQPPPPLQITVVRFGAWRFALGVTMAITASVIFAWLVAGADRPVALSIGGAVVTALALGAAASALRTPACRLRWDAERWHLGAARQATEADGAEWSGRVHIAIDGGAWLLLRFSPDGGPPGCPWRWLPVQRRGLEWQWHALRTTLYGARHLTPDPSTAARHSAAE